MAEGACVARGACMAGCVCMARGHAWPRGCVAPKTTTAVGGMHPTGLHSCFKNIMSKGTNYK